MVPPILRSPKEHTGKAEEAMIDTAQKFVIGKLEELDEEELPVRLSVFSWPFPILKGHSYHFNPFYIIHWAYIRSFFFLRWVN